VALGGRTSPPPSRGAALPRERAALRRGHRTSLDALRAIPAADALGPSRARWAARCASETWRDVRVTTGPPMIRDEAGMLVGYVYVDLDRRDMGATSRTPGAPVESAHAAEARCVFRRATAASGRDSTSCSSMEERMKISSRSRCCGRAAALSAVPQLHRGADRAALGALRAGGKRVGALPARLPLSTAVWVGVIALVGLAAQTGVVMIVYIDHAYLRRLNAGKINSLEDIVEAHAEGTIQRVRPKLMTVGTMLHGPGAAALGGGAMVGRRRDEAHRGADGRGPGDQRLPDAGDHPGDLHVLAQRAAGGWVQVPVCTHVGRRIGLIRG
jgi:Cu(I)/Ag(I) efflux system membrane protein CusA/SilA